MATKSKIVITFNDVVYLKQFISFSYQKDGNGTLTRESFVSQRLQAGYIDIGGDSITGQQAAQAYRSAFRADWNGSGIFDIGVTGNVVTIEVVVGYTLFGFAGTAGTAVITNGTDTNFKLDSWEVLPHPTNKCDRAILRINTTEDAVKYRRATVMHDLPNPASVIDIDIHRAITENSFILYNADDEEIFFSIEEGYIFVGQLLALNVNINITNTNSGATVIADVSFPYQNTPKPELVLEYSLNGVDFQLSNIFTGQLPGTHTLYVRDNLGCSVQKEFIVDEYVDNVKPIFYISNNNSVFFSKEEFWDNQDIMKNDSNVLSKSDLVGINYREELLYQREDTITIQFKSNYTLHEANILNCENESSAIPIEKKSNNLGRFMSLDSTIYQYKLGYTGIYFMSGNIYDENNNIINQYILNGNLPDFAIVGQSIELIVDGLPSGYYKIEDIVYDSKVEKRAIIIKRPHDGEAVDAISRSTYNLLEYEIYEFSLAFQTLLEEFYRLHIKAERAGFTTQNYYSETIHLKDIHPKTLSISYWGEGNSDIFYAYGIKHFIRLKYEQIEALIDDTVQIVNGDNISAMVESDLYDGNKILFDSMTRGRFLQAAIALSNPNLYINNIGYIKKNSISYENIENTNLYNLTVELAKTGVGINEHVENPSIAGPSVNIPSILVGNTGLIKL